MTKHRSDGSPALSANWATAVRAQAVTRHCVDAETYRVERLMHEQASNAACEYSDEVDRLTEALEVARSALDAALGKDRA